jgi:hypothetical protein
MKKDIQVTGMKKQPGKYVIDAQGETNDQQYKNSEVINRKDAQHTPHIKYF